MTSFKDAKVGEKVWSVEFGWGEIMKTLLCLGIAFLAGFHLAEWFALVFPTHYTIARGVASLVGGASTWFLLTVRDRW